MATRIQLLKRRALLNAQGGRAALAKSRILVRKGQPSAGDVYVSRPLTNISVAYMQDEALYIADKVFPAVPVQHQSDQYYIFNRKDWLRNEAQLRAPASETAGGGFRITTDSYNAKVIGFHRDVDDQTRANADSVLQLDRAASEFVSHKILIKREIDWANKFFKAGVWATDHTPAVLWSAAGSDPAKDMEVAKLAVRKTGRKANTLVLGAEVLSALRYNDAIREQYKYTNSDSINDAMIAAYFGVDRVFEMGAVFANAAEEFAYEDDFADIQFIGGKHALLCYSAPSPSLMTPTAGYTFVWNGLTGSNNGIRTKKFRMEPISSDRIETEAAYDQKVVASAMGYFFANVVA